MTKIQQKPIIHGRDHMPGGADPIPGTTAGFTTYRELIEAAGPWAYWPLDDTSGDLHEEIAARDMATYEWPLSGGYEFHLGYGRPGPFTDDAGTSVEFAGFDSSVVNTIGTHANYPFATGEGTEVFGATGNESFSLEYWFYPVEPAVPTQTGPPSYDGFLVCFGNTTDQMWTSRLTADGVFRFVRGSLTLQASPILGGWNYVAVVYDGATVSLYLNGSLADSGASGSVTSGDYTIQLGRQTISTGRSGYFEGMLAHVALYTEPLDADTIAKHMAGQLGPPPPGSGWQFPPPPPPSDGAPVGVGSPPGGWTGGTNPGGYYYQAHMETVVLTDSSPGRFDVPPRTWTRIPFNTVHIQRQFQPSSSSPAATIVLLPDDRGLTAAAANGVLLLPDAAYEAGDPTPEQQIYAWCNPEYPPVDGDRLPNYTAPPWSSAPDRYCRALRIRNATTGNILRAYDYLDGTWRVFFEWPFADAGAPEGLSMARNDNPFPKYPPWPARPMHKNLPYPEIPGGITEWLDYYENEDGYPRWLPIGASQHWDPGTKFVAEVWQDTPYLLRFTTNIYPHHQGILRPPGWTGGDVYKLEQPYLIASYPFDPATIDHTTGRLL